MLIHKSQRLGVLRLFDAPQIFMQIPDIKQLYEINDGQERDLDTAVEELENNLFFETMGEENVKKWEALLQSMVPDSDTLDDRRLRVKAKTLEKMPYTYRTLVRRLETLCPDGYKIETFDEENGPYMNIKVALKSKRMIDAVQELLEECLPLNVSINVMIMYNTYEVLEGFAYEELEKFTYEQLREEVLV